MNQHTSLNDEKLFQLCQSYGEQARIWKQKFAGLIPEVFRRKLYIKKALAQFLNLQQSLEA